MNKESRVSVCMATYNGERYITEQLISIISQLKATDELIIIDDCSVDRTFDIVTRFSEGDNRIRVFKNEFNLGVNQTFDIAINKATGDIIFLSDQDDVWVPGRVEVMKNSLCSQGKSFLSSNFNLIDSSGNLIKSVNDFSLSPGEGFLFNLRNILNIFTGRISYYGCAMCFTKDFARSVTPFPHFVESHDLWIAMAANVKSDCIHLKDITLSRRIHGSNVSVVSRSFKEKFISRFVFMRSLFCILSGRNNSNRRFTL
ncbi:glycosyltransferase [Alishewanella sp. HH-ZS]|uniref:glycosyltransferase n=1 Tax=Alishewanella sp. HH-ZS TaxID=1856684 RepID=UPI00082362DE|nr:glycosyltransferase [Alishewanella sp. HH-ZS]OCW96323.1 hypothetical protein A9165_12215 [Alishewanella sp. HH-ZS]